MLQRAHETVRSGEGTYKEVLMYGALNVITTTALPHSFHEGKREIAKRICQTLGPAEHMSTPMTVVLAQKPQ